MPSVPGHPLLRLLAQLEKAATITVTSAIANNNFFITLN
jgi:hypothetical protein